MKKLINRESSSENFNDIRNFSDDNHPDFHDYNNKKYFYNEPSFDEYTKSTTPKYKFLIIAYFIFFYCLAISTNSTGLYIGIMQQNATCYDNAVILSLSHWLILSTGTCVVTNAIMLIGLLCVWTIDNLILLAIYTNLSLIISYINIFFLLTMNIIGGLEIGYQFEDCKHEKIIVCIVHLGIIIINTINFLSSSYLIKLKNEQGENYVNIP